MKKLKIIAIAAVAIYVMLLLHAVVSHSGVYVALVGGTGFIVIMFLVLNYCVRRTDGYRRTLPDMENFPVHGWNYTHSQRNFDIANIGSSSAKHAFDYAGCDVKAFNWAMQPQSMEYSFKILQACFSIIRQNGIILIPFCPFSGLDVTGKWAERVYDKYALILEPRQMKHYQKRRLRLMFPLLFSPVRSLYYLYRALVVPPPAADLQERRQNFDFEANAVWWIESWKHEFNIASLEEPLSDDNLAGQNRRIGLVREMIDFCQKRELCPVLVFPPMHPSLSGHFSESFRRNYIYSFIDKANVVGIPFLDYMDDPEFTADEYYTNSYLMSRLGAQTFTKKLIDDLRDAAYIQKNI